MRFFFAKSILLIFALAIYSCDNSVEPLDTDTGIYSVYGAMDLNKDVNYIRIRDLNAPFTAEATETIDATVFFENLETGMIETLEGIQQEYEGIYQYNFVLDQPLQPDTDYRLVVERSDGAAVQIPVTTPTKPAPQVSPLNQDCYVPIHFKLEPTNGGTVVLRVGLGPDEDSIWGQRYILKSDDDQASEKATFTFTPNEQVNDALPGSGSGRQCGQYLDDGNIYLSYIHYGPGFYEQVNPETANAIGTHRIGGIYYDTLTIPVDTSPVCPEDCF